MKALTSTLFGMMMGLMALGTSTASADTYLTSQDLGPYSIEYRIPVYDQLNGLELQAHGYVVVERVTIHFRNGGSRVLPELHGEYSGGSRVAYLNNTRNVTEVSVQARRMKSKHSASFSLYGMEPRRGRW